MRLEAAAFAKASAFVKTSARQVGAARKTEVGGQKSEIRGQRADDRGQKADDRGQKADDRGQKAGGLRGWRLEERCARGWRQQSSALSSFASCGYAVIRSRRYALINCKR